MRLGVGWTGIWMWWYKGRGGNELMKMLLMVFGKFGKWGIDLFEWTESEMWVKLKRGYFCFSQILRAWYMWSFPSSSHILDKALQSLCSVSQSLYFSLCAVCAILLYVHADLELWTCKSVDAWQFNVGKRLHVPRLTEGWCEAFSFIEFHAPQGGREVWTNLGDQRVVILDAGFVISMLSLSKRFLPFE